MASRFCLSETIMGGCRTRRFFSGFTGGSRGTIRTSAYTFLAGNLGKRPVGDWRLPTPIVTALSTCAGLRSVPLSVNGSAGDCVRSAFVPLPFDESLRMAITILSHAKGLPGDLACFQPALGALCCAVAYRAARCRAWRAGARAVVWLWHPRCAPLLRVPCYDLHVVPTCRSTCSYM